MARVQADLHNIASQVSPVMGLVPQSLTDNSTATGIAVDLAAWGIPKSVEVVALVSWTVASAAAGDTMTLTLTVNQSNVVGMTGSTQLAQVVAVAPWVSNATLRSAVVVLPIDLANSLEFIQPTLKAHGVSSGGTYSAEVGAIVLNFGGMWKLPYSGYADAGWLASST